MTARALFLDRDGIINLDHGYVFRPEEFELQPGIVELLREAQASGFLLIVVTNQSGIARGMFSECDYQALEQHMRAVLEAEGVRLTAVYHCPHHPEGAVPALAIACDCRKPRPGMFLKAAADHAVDLGRSIMIGDKHSDMEAANAARVGTSYLVEPSRVAADLARIRATVAQA